MIMMIARSSASMVVCSEKLCSDSTYEIVVAVSVGAAYHSFLYT